MINVKISLVDFMEGSPVMGADVTAKIKVVPRWLQSLSDGPDLGGGIDLDDLGIPGRPPGGGGGPLKPLPDFPMPDMEMAIELVKSGDSQADGTFSASFNAFSAFQRQRALRKNNRPPKDVIAVLEVNVKVAALDQTVHYYRGIGEEDGQGVIHQSDSVNQTISLDFAKAIVGHTTPNSTKLWFCLHGNINSSDHYVCEIDADNQIGTKPSGPPLQSIVVPFNAAKANTAVIDVDNLATKTDYRYRLWHRSAAEANTPRAGRLITYGSFKTAPAANDDVNLTFASCHLPTDNNSLERWRALSNRDPADLMLLMGDQIYADNVTEKGDWFESYIERYHHQWTAWPMREVLRHTPTYMVLDDHEVDDDWGIKPETPEDVIPRDRIKAGTDAYRIFQQSHGPSGHDGDVHYSFRWGPASVFVMDSRTQRDADPENARFPILGEAQWQAMQEWAAAPETRDADVIIFVSPVPIAFLPVEEVERLVQELEDAATGAGATVGSVLGALAGGLIGGLAAGPPGILAGAAIGGGIGAGGGAYIAHDLAEGEIDDNGLGNLTDRDLADMWTYEPNQVDMVRVLGLLFDLANDVTGSGRLARPGPKQRAVFVLGGDVHAGAVHAIRSNRTDAASQSRHRRNPVMFQLISSAISKTPATHKTFEKVVSYVKDGAGVSAWDIIRTAGDFEEIAGSTFGEENAQYVLDSKHRKNYAAEFVELVSDRNFGNLKIERVDPNRRVYRFYVTIEARTDNIKQAFEIDLDAGTQVEIKDVYGGVNQTKGKVDLLRVHDRGTGYGPSTDRINGEVVVKLDSTPENAYGFQLRTGGSEANHQGMLNILRDAFNHDRSVHIDYIRTGYNNGQIIRVRDV